MNENDGIPYYTVRRVLKSHIERELSQQYVINVKRVLNDILIHIAKASLRELESTNRLRFYHNLRPLKRVHYTQPTIEKYIFTYVDTGVASQDLVNSDTGSSIGRSYQ